MSMFVGNLSKWAFIFNVPSSTTTPSFILLDKVPRDPPIQCLLVLIIYFSLFIVCMYKSLVIVGDYRIVFFYSGFRIEMKDS